METWIKPHSIRSHDGTLLLLYIQPGASRSVIKGIHGDRLKVSIQAPPVEGAANEAVIAFFAKLLGVSKSSVHLLSGETSRQKNLWIEGKTPEDVQDCIGG